MRSVQLVILLATLTLAFSASCVRSPMLADASDAVAQPTATDAVLVPTENFIEMPPLYVDSAQSYGQKIEKASADATELCARTLRCPTVRVRRADLYERPDGTTWTVVRLNACGEERVYEKTRWGWNEATARLR